METDDEEESEGDIVSSTGLSSGGESKECGGLLQATQDRWLRTLREAEIKRSAMDTSVYDAQRAFSTIDTSVYHPHRALRAQSAPLSTQASVIPSRSALGAAVEISGALRDDSSPFGYPSNWVSEHVAAEVKRLAVREAASEALALALQDCPLATTPSCASTITYNDTGTDTDTSEDSRSAPDEVISVNSSDSEPPPPLLHRPPTGPATPLRTTPSLRVHSPVKARRRANLAAHRRKSASPPAIVLSSDSSDSDADSESSEEWFPSKLTRKNALASNRVSASPVSCKRPRRRGPDDDDQQPPSSTV